VQEKQSLRLDLMTEGTIRVGSKVVVSGREELGVATVRYIGPTKFAAGEWVGVEYEQPVGKNDGSVQGTRYWSCQPNHGLFVRPSQVVSFSSSSIPPSTQGKATAASNTMSSSIFTPTPTLAPPSAKPSSTSVETATSTTTSAATTIHSIHPQQQQTSIEDMTSKQETHSVEELAIVEELNQKIRELTVTYETEKLKYEKQIQILQENLKNLEASMATEQQQSRATIKQLRENLESALKRNEELSNQIQSAKKVELVAQKTNPLQTEIERLQKEIEEMKQKYEQQIANLQEDLEVVTVDKELAEEKYEQLTQEMETLKGELKVLQLFKQTVEEKEEKRLHDLKEGNTAQMMEDVQILLAQNERLKEALLKLKDISILEKQQQEMKIRELEKRTETIPELENKIASLMRECATKEKEIAKLKEMLDETKDLQEKFEQFFEKHQNLLEENRELKATVKDLETLRDLAEEMEETQAAVEKKLRSELYQKQIEIVAKDAIISNLQNKLSETETAVQKLKHFITEQKKEIEELKEREEIHRQQNEKIQENLKLIDDMRLQIQAHKIKTTAKEIDDELRSLEIKQAQELSSLFRLFLPEGYLRQETESMTFYTLMKRIDVKCELILRTLNRQHSIDALDNLEDSDPLLRFILDLYHIVEQMDHVAQHFLTAFSQSDEETFLKLGKFVYEFQVIETQLDHLLSSIKDEKLRADYPLHEFQRSLERAENFVAKIFTSKGGVEIPMWRQYKHFLQELFYYTKCIAFEQRTLARLIMSQSQEHGTPQSISLCLPNTFLRNILDMIKKSIKNVNERRLKNVITLREQFELVTYAAKLILETFLELNDKLKQMYDIRGEVSISDSETMLNSISKYNSLKDLFKLKGQNEQSNSQTEPFIQQQKQPGDRFLEFTIQFLSTFNENLTRGTFDDKETDQSKIDQHGAIKRHAARICEEITQAAQWHKEIDDLNNELQAKEKLIRSKNELIEQFQWKEQKLESKITTLETAVKELSEKLDQQAKSAMNKEKMHEQTIKALHSELAKAQETNRSLLLQYTTLQTRAREQEQLLQATTAKIEESVTARAAHAQVILA